jgi:cytochrome c biogenesis protein CcmG/thiol:disulfide interchange protein DsbE
MARMSAERAGAAWKKPLVGAGVALLVFLGYFVFTSPESTKIKVGMPAPELDLPSLGTGTMKLSSFRGKPLLLFFFMADCALCEKEVPQVELLSRELRQRGLLVVGVTVDRDYAVSQSFLKRHDVSFGIFRDPNGDAVYQAFGSYKMPEAYLIDSAGKVAAVWLGAVDWRSPKVRAKIDEVLPRQAKEAS